MWNRRRWFIREPLPWVLFYILYVRCKLWKMKVQTLQKRSCYFRKTILNFPGTWFNGYETLYLLKFTLKDCLLNPNILSGCVVFFRIYPILSWKCLFIINTRYRIWKIKRWDREEERTITKWDRYVGRADPGIIFMNSLFWANHSFSYRQLSDVCSSRTMGPIITKFDNNWVTGIQVYSIKWSCPVKMRWRILKFFSTMIQTNSAQTILE